MTCKHCGEEASDTVCPDCAIWLDNYEPSDADMEAAAGVLSVTEQYWAAVAERERLRR
jgi:hypothetical protein